jgi:hypothetical protein
VRGLPAARRCWRQLAISFFSRHFRSWSLLIGQRGSGDPLPAGCIMRFERVRRRPDRLRPCLQDGLEGIVSKKASAYRSGCSRDWLKKKNPDAPVATREAEEDWS